MTTHPILPTGFNSWDINGDEVDGAGVNEPVWPTFFDSFVPLEVIFITEPMLDVFGTECPDLVVPHEEWIQLFPLAEFPLELKGPWPQIIVKPVADTIVWKGTDDTLVIQGRSPAWGIAPQRSTQVLPAGTDTRVIQ